ncbi:NAD(P)/FAD-dependent oxidoreductase [Rhodococcus sp. ARC_M5]|uniref:NAD(P)/FAD-dependent oxidoreductase n=1 Tax=Rhodococcus sp. ARC_M5 TaxID=2928851 RepID=UPI001FB29978|nr:FAD-dependent oxidoreductase [Rhodococcus sp. ARC_M5]MCJ0894171.1 FAD-dependent oxidoreductase [Rhodococcus sp. ARC_M5]
MPDSAGSTATADPTTVDVAVLGGGICGLTLALELRQKVPGLSVTVVEKSVHPVKEATHKVGESTVEIQAHYLRDILGLGEHLESDQIRKFGLRMFFTYGDNEDIAKRVEYGQTGEAPLATYQLDRGRIENELGTRIQSAGATFETGTRVVDVALGTGDEPHSITVTKGGSERRLAARWVIDASGRASILKRQLGLQKSLPHEANSSWFRLEGPVDVDNWSDNAEWRDKVPSGKRRLSTNHLMGQGYWVWLIPLASGSTSVGVVADAKVHPFTSISTFEKTLAFLQVHEPQLAAHIVANREKLQDFRAMRDYAYGAERVFSGYRWCLTGEAGVSIDPLYSSGGDLMAISNGLITDLVARDHAGEDIGPLADIHDQVYLLVSDMWLLIYQDQFAVMGNAQVMVAKVLWDTMIYWAVPGTMYFHDQLRRMFQSPPILTGLVQIRTLHSRVEQFFREWSAIDNPVVSDHFADPYLFFGFFLELHEQMATDLSDGEFEDQLLKNVALLEQCAGQLGATVMDKLRDSTDPAATAQLTRWRADKQLADLVNKYRVGAYPEPIDGSWITFGGPQARVPA